MSRVPPSPVVPGGVNLADSVQRRAVERGYLNWFWAQHASELTRQVLLETSAQSERDRYYAIERILELMCEEYKAQKRKPLGRVNWIQSRAFDVAEVRRLSGKRRRSPTDHVLKAREDVLEVLPTSDAIITLFATMYKGGGGHYCAVLYTKKDHTVRIWDSMGSVENVFVAAVKLVFDHPFDQLPLTVDAPKPTAANPSTLRIVRDDVSCRFDHESKHIVPQQTGGFVANTARWVQSALANKLISKDEWLELRSFASEAQNHFCYGWALWTLQLLLAGQNVCATYEQLFHDKQIDSLTVVKKYLYAVIHCRKLAPLGLPARIAAVEPDGFAGFWHKHFLCIHGIDPEQRIALRVGRPLQRKPIRFVYECVKPPTKVQLATLRGCLAYSMA